MTTYAFPSLSLAPSRHSFGQRSNTVVHVSPTSGSVQTIELPGARWTVAANFNKLYAADGALMRSFLSKMRGQANRFTWHDITAPVPRGTMRGTMTVSGAVSQGANTCSVTAGAGEAGKTLLEGDRLLIGTELKMVVSDATANGSGVIALTVEPPFRNAVSGGAAVTWDRPTATFMLSDVDWSIDADGVCYNASIDAVEVW